MYKERTKSEYEFEIAKYAGGIKEITSNTTYEQLTKIRKTCPFSIRYYKLNTQIFDNEVLKSLKLWITQDKESNEKLLEIILKYKLKHKKLRYIEYNSDDILFVKNNIQKEISNDSIAKNFNYYLDLGYCFVKIYTNKEDIEVYIRK